MAKAVAFITDEKISGLSTVLNPLQFGKYLRPVLPSKWGVLQDVELQVLKHHRGKRCTLDITLQTSTGKHALIGKVYAKDRSDVYRAMKQIGQFGFGPEAEFSIPQPYAFIPELRLLLQEKVGGPLTKKILLNSGERGRTRAGERCACWLAHFHTQAPLSGPVHVLTDERMEDCVSRLAKRAGSLGDKARLLFDQLQSRSVDCREMRACHLGYSYHQIILTETRVVTF